MPCRRGPAAAFPTIQDAFRQTQALLSADLELCERVMNLQLQILSANSKLRSPEAAALSFLLVPGVHSQRRRLHAYIARFLLFLRSPASRRPPLFRRPAL